ncbi:hypothetical protein SacmaDRAFT_4891 [Saccharomonospora marina XMU15]|uniref:Uncharacterized protein n=1 Tax=Saccharomonospora marina XMU15 TaxID=882083 RepID=H5X105_9PSEU|nr:hypothetical protein [Saccharomonospora marina]EHR53064.1 hypothetical protein SacmaDRAFT_4891 [Saccharomonospora marina XMU15]
MRRKVALLLVALAAAAVAGCTADTGGDVDLGPVAFTNTVVLEPFTESGDVAEWVSVDDTLTASCKPSLFDKGNLNARLCFTGETTTALDPCFVPTEGEQTKAVCLPDPSGRNAIQLDVTDQKPPKPNRADNALPWFVELRDGARCEVVGDVGVTLEGLPMTYGCDDGSFLYGPPDSADEVWLVRQQAKGAERTRQVPVRTAWW